MSPTADKLVPPPFLVGAALVFWGWQVDLLLPGLLMAVLLEAPRWVKLRWEFTNEDFSRIWTFCTLLLLGAVLYAFTRNDGPNDFRGFFTNPNPATQRDAGVASARTAAAMLRWLPMTFFPFLAAQVYSVRESIPLETISLILRLRWRKARRAGAKAPPGRNVNVAYYYFVICLFAAGIHPAENTTYFWGLCGLLGWALWALRSRRFGLVPWAAAMIAAVGLGYAGQRGVSYLRSYLENLNPQWFSRFARGGFDPTQSRTAIGKIGRIKLSGSIVIRLETPPGQSPPDLLREASYRSYKAQTWYSETAEKDYEILSPDQPNGTTYLLQPGKTNQAVVQVGCYLPGGKGLLPLPADSGQLDRLQAYDLRKNAFGAVLAQGPGLVIFDAHYRPGPTLDSAADPETDLSVPPRESPALQRVLAEMGVRRGDGELALKKMRAFFIEKFNYRTWQDVGLPARGDDTPLARFLLETRAGHCEYFATATVLLLRELGIPARYATGFAVHEKSFSHSYVVRQRDAHAWCLVWDEAGRAWRDFDTTPASWAVIEGQRASPLQWLSDFWSRLAFEFSKFRWGQTQIRQYILYGLGPVLALLLYQILFRSRRRRKQAEAAAAARDWPGLDSEFYQLEKTLAARGVPRGPGEPLSEWLRRAAADPALDALSGPLHGLLRLHYRYRFDPRGLEPADRRRLRDQTSACLRQLAGGGRVARPARA